MKTSELRLLSQTQIQDEYAAALRSYAECKLQSGSSSRITRRDARRQIARILTVIRQQVPGR